MYEIKSDLSQLGTVEIDMNMVTETELAPWTFWATYCNDNQTQCKKLTGHRDTYKGFPYTAANVSIARSMYAQFSAAIEDFKAVASSNAKKDDEAYRAFQILQQKLHEIHMPFEMMSNIIEAMREVNAMYPVMPLNQAPVMRAAIRDWDELLDLLKQQRPQIAAELNIKCVPSVVETVDVERAKEVFETLGKATNDSTTFTWGMGKPFGTRPTVSQGPHDCFGIWPIGKDHELRVAKSAQNIKLPENAYMPGAVRAQVYARQTGKKMLKDYHNAKKFHDAAAAAAAAAASGFGSTHSRSQCSVLLRRTRG